MKRDQTATGLGDLNDLIAATEARTHRPRITPREVAGQALQSALGGVGAGVAYVALAYLFGVPWPIVETGVVVTLVFAGGAMAARAVTDELLDVRRLRVIQATAKRAVEEKSKRLAYACQELDTLEATIEERDATITRLLRDHELTQLELARLKDQLQPKSWTPAVDPDAGVKADAMEMLTHYFRSGGVWYSRDKAKGAGWSAARHANAQKMLVQAGVIWINVKQPQMNAKSLDEATDMLLTYIRKMAVAGVTPRREDEDNDYE